MREFLNTIKNAVILTVLMLTALYVLMTIISFNFIWFFGIPTEIFMMTAIVVFFAMWMITVSVDY